MSRITITLHIDIPECARVATPDVDYADDLPPEPEYVKAPLPTEGYDPDVRVVPVASPAPGCPQHGAMTRFPAGTNKAGKPYNASWRCATKDCPTKPIWDRDAA